MSTGPVDLLRLLASGTQGPDRAPRQAGELTFERLLEMARSAGPAGGAPVRISPAAGVELSEAQMARLARAADRLEEAGATRALVILDGRALSLDVATRTVTGSVALEAGRPLVGFDAILHLPDASNTPSPVLQPPALPTTNPSLARVLPDARRSA